MILVNMIRTSINFIIHHYSIVQNYCYDIIFDLLEIFLIVFITYLHVSVRIKRLFSEVYGNIFYAYSILENNSEVLVTLNIKYMNSCMVSFFILINKILYIQEN